jgi:DNA transformation protein
MAVRPQYLDYLLDQLAGLGALRWRRMFGGVGLYHADTFFAVIDDDTLYFKTGEGNRREYQARGMPRFMPMPGREAAMAYHQVPEDVIEDAVELVAWARGSVAAARAAVKPRRAPERAARDRPATRKAPSRSNRGTHRRG